MKSLTWNQVSAWRLAQTGIEAEAARLEAFLNTIVTLKYGSIQ